MGDIAMHVRRRESAGVLPRAGLHPEVTPKRGCRDTDPPALPGGEGGGGRGEACSPSRRPVRAPC